MAPKEKRIITGLIFIFLGILLLLLDLPIMRSTQQSTEKNVTQYLGIFVGIIFIIFGTIMLFAPRKLGKLPEDTK